MAMQGTTSFIYAQPVTYEKPYVDANGEHLIATKVRDDSLGGVYPVLTKSAQEDDLNTRLGLAPHLEFYPFPSTDQVFVSNWLHKSNLKGDIVLDILSLLASGDLNGDQLVQRLQNKYSDLEVRSILYYLIAKDIVVSVEHGLTATQALFWAHVGLTPCAAEQRLAALPLHITSLTDEPFPETILTKMQELGGWHYVDNPDDASLIIYRVDNYLQAGIEKINAQHLADGKQWVLVQLKDEVAMFGPLFCATPNAALTNRPCWECLRVVMRQGITNMDIIFMQNKRLPRLKTNVALHQDAVGARLQAELGGLLRDNQAQVALRGHLLTSTLPHLNFEYHWVAQRPQCRACCEDEGRWDASRTPQPLRLQACATQNFTSGGIRSKSPQQAFKQWRKHISSLTGITDRVTYCQGTYHGIDGSKWDWFYNASGGKNYALDQEHLKSLRKGFRGAAGGKGSTAEQAWVSLICESFERSAGVFKDRGELYRWARFNDFKDGEAITPNSIALFSDRQYRNREAINSIDNPYYRVPLPFEPEQKTMWTPVWSLTQERHKYLVTQGLYYSVETIKPEVGKNYYACSNGCASGGTLEEAILQGLYELIERDACAIWWYNRLHLPPVDLESFDDPWLQRAKTFYATFQRDLWVIDMTTDLGVPCCVALSRKIKEGCKDTVLFGFGAHLNQRIATYRAISEMNQMLSSFEVDRSEERDVREWAKTIFCGTAAEWIDVVKVDAPSFKWLCPNKSAVVSSYTHPQLNDALDEINYLRAIIENKGMEMLVLDQTRADVDCPVVKVIVPGLRHFWCRLGPGRLYDVPVAEGWLSQPRREEEMNPISMFI